MVTAEQQAEGSLRLPLVSPSSNGNVYRLVGATFNIVGPQTVTLSDDTSADTVQTMLQAGSYTIELAGAWRMERLDAPGTAVPVQLLSPNPLPLIVTKGETSQVRFQFKYPGDGAANVGIGVDSGGWLAGTIQFTQLEYQGGEPTPFAELVDKSVPFLISFETASTTKSSWSEDLQVTTAPITFQFGGAPSALLQRAAADLSGLPIFFELRGRPGGFIEFSNASVPSQSGEFRFELHQSTPFQGSFDSEGYPARRPFQFDTTVVLRDYMNGVRGTVTVNGSP
jgi:hypothetical protein